MVRLDNHIRKSNEHIRQALISSIANSDLELTFRQSCTAEERTKLNF